MSASAGRGREVFVLDGRRTPFQRSGTAFSDLMAYELGAMALSGLLDRTRLDPARVGRVVLGTVLQDPRTSNVAREAALAASLPDSVPATTVTAACISANVAIVSAVEGIASGEVDLAIAGGTETLSDVPIRFRRPVRKRLIASQKARGPLGMLKLAKGLKPTDLLPETPALAEFSTGQTMGENAERLAKRFGLSRDAQDRYALASHQKAHRAAEERREGDQIVPVRVGETFAEITRDNGVRGDSTLEKLASLPPAFDRRFGTVTAGNSSFLTDGAAVVLLGTADAAKDSGLAPLARVASSALVSSDPKEELLLGPAYAIPKALARAGVTLADIGVLEIHEAFAAPMLALKAALAAASVGDLDETKLNLWGGSLSIGHPFGATGARLVATCARRLHAENARWGLVASCAAGALGHAIVLERA